MSLSSSALDDKQLNKLAREQLGLSSLNTQPIPAHYVTELRRHVNIYPMDTHFRVQLQPGRGFGLARCLEDSCTRVLIPLTKRSNTSVPDGGIACGFGSLAAYRQHVLENPTHRAARDKRVKTKENDGILATTPTRSIYSIKSEPFTAPLRHLKQENFDAPLSTKRPNAEPAFSASPKRVKLERPLDRTSSSFSDLSNVVPRAPQVPTKSLALQLNEVKACIKQKELFLESKKKKKQPTGAVDNQLRDLQRRKSMFEAQIASGRPPKTEVVDDGISFARADVQESKPVVPFIVPYTSPQQSVSPATPYARPSRPLPYRASVKPELTSVASSSKLDLFDIPKMFRSPSPADDSSDNEEFYAPLFPFIRPNSDGDESDYASMDTDDEKDKPNPMEIVNKVLAAGAVPHVAPAANADAYDQNGDYHGRGRDLYAGPQAAPSDFNAFVKMAGAKEQFDQDATVDKSLAMLGMEDKKNKLEGLTITLMDHQIIGVAWMVAKEKTSMKGGILGDDMGLGKTIQMLATMVKNRSDDPMCKTNLIIAPMALLEQWKQEIETKSDCDMKCLIYHGSGKAKIKKSKELLKFDVVLTTYSTMALEWPDYEAEFKAKAKAKRRKSVDGFLVSDSDGEDIKPAKKQKAKGLLFQTEFYRIILDEAQNIRNKRTRASRAASELMGKYHWALTGTIIINSIVDVYACFRFVAIRPWHDWNEFNVHIGLLEKKQPDLAATRLQAILSTCHLRRLKTTMMHGEPLIKLPPKEVELIRLEFTAEERSVYDMVEKQSQAAFNRFLRAGAVLKNYHHILVLLLRLRQICSHPSLIQENGGAFIEADEAHDDYVEEALREDISRARRLVSPEFVQRLREKYKAAALAAEKAEKENIQDAVAETSEECSICSDLFADPVVSACTHEFCRKCIEDVLDSPQNEEQAGDTMHKYAAHERPCPSCRSPICKDKLFRRAAFKPTEADLKPQIIEIKDSSDEEEEEVIIRRKPAGPKKKRAIVGSDDEDMTDSFAPKASSPPPSSPVRRSSRARRRSTVVVSSDIEETGPGDDVNMSEDEDEYTNDEDLDGFIVPDDADKFETGPSKKKLGKRRAMAVYDSDDEDIMEGKEQVIFGVKKKTKKLTPEQIKFMPRFLPSTKMKHMMETLLKLQKEKPDEKTIVVSQWTSCLKLVSDYLTEHSIPHVKYQGDMRRDTRDKAVTLFMANDKARVLLMSLKCGGVGLNLTRANNLITLDLAWSQAIERQAFDRIHRMGQQRDVKINRLVIEKTVEDRILALQERKQNIADGSLGEGAGKKIGRLTVTELANLFGLDGRGRVLEV